MHLKLLKCYGTFKDFGDSLIYGVEVLILVLARVNEVLCKINKSSLDVGTLLFKPTYLVKREALNGHMIRSKLK